jgi:hypothetical protein
MVGCGEAAAPTIPPGLDRDASVPSDGSTDMDGSVDDGGMADGGTGGASTDGAVSWCETSELCPYCPDRSSLCDERTPCSLGEVCLPTGCEDLSRCFAIGGGACEQDQDCANLAYACEPTIGRCLRLEPGCDDSNDCVAGFACENETCVDRRLPCSGGDDCPHGYTCFVASPDQRFCRRITRPCGDDVDCLVLGVPCGDADGDGAKECMPSLIPNAPDAVSCDIVQCNDGAAPVCETTSEGVEAVCGRFGLCSSTVQCPDGFECRDLWGDGRSECVAGPGSCVDSRSCPPRSLCASPRTGGEPRCIGTVPM